MDQIHRLNYRTFVEEIPQHPAAEGRRLIDKFHSKNVYLVALEGSRVVGMTAIHDQPPFSIEDRLPDPKALDSYRARSLEVRLLAVDPCHRSGQVFAGLSWLVYRHALDRGKEHLLISGFEQRRKFYERIGFKPLGAGVPSGNARFIPMILTLSSLPESIRADLGHVSRWVSSLNGDGFLAGAGQG
ncbi:MAG: GNAT family N-acetyltransferase [Candidatus Omnitrophica bacterium]|nr:GNAT family N-acetyltransferase [Candidatus Omnitrophota bacterium]